VPGAILFSKVGEAASRFPDFVAELRGFLESNGLVPGEPDAAGQLAERVAEGGVFRDDLASMLRVMYLQEPETSYLQLLGLLLAAAVGEDEAEALAYAPQAEEPVRELFQFVVDARKGVPEEDEAADEEHAEVPEESFGESVAPEPVGVEAVPASWGSVDPKDVGASVLARALAISADEIVPAPVVEKPGPQERPVALKAEVPTPAFVLPSAEETPRRRVPIWAVGSGGVVLGLLLGLFLHRQGGAPETVAKGPAISASSAAPEASGSVAGREARGRETVSDSEYRRPAGETAALDSREPGTARGKVPGRGGSTPGSSKAGGTAGTAGPASVAGGGAASASVSGATAGKASRPVPGPMIPRVSAVDMNGSPAASSSVGTGARLRMPSVVTGSSGIMAANLISAPAPAYPAQASAARVQGEVVIEAVVGRDGSVVDTRVVSGPELLRSAALSAVQRWQFRPYEVDGTPAEIATTARLEFRLPAE
jgi:TonB family protein